MSNGIMTISWFYDYSKINYVLEVNSLERNGNTNALTVMSVGKDSIKIYSNFHLHEIISTINDPARFLKTIIQIPEGKKRESIVNIANVTRILKDRYAANCYWFEFGEEDCKACFFENFDPESFGFKEYGENKWSK